MKSSGYSLLHCAARSFLCAVSTLITEMRVLSLTLSPGTSKLVLLLPVCCSHKCSSNKLNVKMFSFTLRVTKYEIFFTDGRRLDW